MPSRSDLRDFPGDVESVVERASEWCREGRRVVLATVVSTWRSAPRPVGSRMAIADDGRFAGSVSGGCVEAAVIHEAQALLSGKREAATLRYGVASHDAWEVGLPCGGQIEVFAAEASCELLEALAEAKAQRRSLVSLLSLDEGEQRLFAAADDFAAEPAELAELARSALATGESQLCELGRGRVFVQADAAPLRLVAIGAVHLGQALSEIAQRCGFEVVIVDPRTAFATPQRFPGVRLVHDWPDVAVQALSADERTAVVVLSHDAKLDEPALAAALRSKAFYVGALGSRRTQAARKRRLAEQGFTEGQLSRIHGPVGLAIGARTTAEIAVAIMAEIIGVRRRPEPQRAP